METFKFTDLSGTERTLSNEGGVAFGVSHTQNDDKIIEWVEDGTKLYCFVTADVADEIAASGLRLIKGGGSLLDLDEGDFKTIKDALTTILDDIEKWAQDPCDAVENVEYWGRIAAAALGRELKWE